MSRPDPGVPGLIRFTVTLRPETCAALGDVAARHGLDANETIRWAVQLLARVDQETRRGRAVTVHDGTGEGYDITLDRDQDTDFWAIVQRIDPS